MYGIDPEKSLFRKAAFLPISAIASNACAGGKCCKMSHFERGGVGAAASPPERRRMHRRVPELQQLGIERRHRERAAGHVQRGAVVADQRAGDLQALAVQQRAWRRRTSDRAPSRACRQAVDQQQHLAAGLAARSPGDRGHHLAGDVVGGHAACTRRRPGSPWMPTPISISSSPELEGRLAGGGHGAGGERHAHGAGAAVDLVARAPSAPPAAGPARRRRRRSSRRSPCRPRRGGRSCRSSSRRRRRRWSSPWRACRSSISVAISKFITSPS